MAPNSARNSSGRKKLKNAAVGLRQNIRRSRRYWWQARTAESATGGRLVRGLRGQLEVHVLERRPRHRQVAQALVARERRARQLVQQGGRVVALAGDHLAVAAAPGDPVPRRAGA